MLSQLGINMKKLFATIFLFASMNCFAENPVSGNISILAENPESHTTHIGAGYTEFQLKGMALDTPCKWLNLQSGDSTALAILLSAQVQGKPIKVYYSASLPSPWAPQSCGVTSIQIVN
jgi:hypothetical protein